MKLSVLNFELLLKIKEKNLDFNSCIFLTNGYIKHYSHKLEFVFLLSTWLRELRCQVKYPSRL